MATMQDIADKAGVSRITVSRVLSGKSNVSAKKREIIEYWINELDYQPNLIAQSLISSKSNTIGVMVPNLRNPYYIEIVDAIEKCATLKSYNIILCNYREDTNLQVETFKVLRSRQIDGVLVIPFQEEKEALVEAINSIKKPCIAITKKLPKIPSISTSHYEGGKIVGEYFKKHNRKSLGFFGHIDSSKYKGYKDSGIELNDVINIDESLADFDYAYYILKNHIEEHGFQSDCLFAHNDIAARVAMQVLSEYGYRCPDDIWIVGFDNTYLSFELKPMLSSIGQPTAKIGQIAVDRLIDLIEGNQIEDEIITLLPNLIVRDTSG